MAGSVSDEAFARAVEQMGAATFDQVEAARAVQAASAAKGVPLSLADVLVQQGLLTPGLRENIEKRVQAHQQGGIKQLGAYKLIKKLGEGGMGAVYLAEDTSVGRKVAVKVLPKKYADDREFLTRFRREAQTTGKLNHVNIVSAYTIGEEMGVHYYAMEYCEGETLDRILKQRQFIQWDQAAGVILQVARGLQHAHDHGIIHRDIKPANIFVCAPQGPTRDRAGAAGPPADARGPEDPFAEGFVAKILDLGLSKNIGGTEQSFYTQTGVALGTPHYISPEQAKGERSIDGRTDIYSLGAMFYHLITGQTPFQGSTAAIIMMKHLSEQLPNPRDVREDIPDGVVQIIQKMMAKEPADRYTGCAELLGDLDLVLGGKMPSSNALDAVKSSVAMPRVPRASRSQAPSRDRKAPESPAHPRGTRQQQPVAGRNVKGRRATDDGAALTPPVPARNRKPLYIGAGMLALGLLVLIVALALRSGTGKPEAAVTQPGTRTPGPDAKPVAVRPATTNQTPDTGAVDDPARWNNAIALLALVDPAKDAAVGRWDLKNGVLLPETSGTTAIRMPYRPPEEYDCRVEFTSDRADPNFPPATLGVILAANGHDVNWALFSRKAGFELVDGHDLMSNPTARDTGNWPKPKEPGTVTIQVRRTGLKTWLDGRLTFEFSTDYSNLKSHTQWNLRGTGVLGLGVLGGAVFRRFDVLEITGKGTFTRPDDPAAKEAERKRAARR